MARSQLALPVSESLLRRGLQEVAGEAASPKASLSFRQHPSD